MENTRKDQLFADMYPHALTGAEQRKIRDFMDSITEEQAAQILDLYNFTETFDITAGDKEDPDRHIKGHTNPRIVADDLAIILLAEGSLEDVQRQIELTAQLSEINKEYWRRLGHILGKPGGKLPSITRKLAKTIDFPIDKVNAKVWKMLEKTQNGQIGIDTSATNQPLITLYSINFDALGDNVTISRKLEPFDRRVYLIVSALYNAGNKVISLSSIYKTMGYTSAPNKNDIAKIDSSLTKMAAAHLSLDNTEEARAYKYDKFVYSASLLPMERIDGIVNGKAVEAAIHLFREPPLISYARGRKQITTIDRKLLETPVNKTAQTILIEDYLLERISHAKTGRQPKKILFSTLYEETGIKEKKQRQRAGKKIDAILNHYVSCGYIKSFTNESDGIRIET